MPKGDRKAKHSKGSRRGDRQEYDEYEDDTLSVAGSVSTNSTISSDSDGEDDETEMIDDLRSRIDEYITDTESKSSKKRADALTKLCNLFSERYTPDSMDAMQETLLATVQRLVRRGSDGEKIAAWRLAGVLILQLGYSDESKHYMEELTPSLTSTYLDHTKSQQLRAMCANILALGNFILGDLHDYVEITDKYESVLGSASCQCGDILAAVILECWPCLLSLMPPSLVHSKAETLIHLFKQFLDSKDAAVRLAAGEAVAAVYELSREPDSDFACSCHDEIAHQVKTLATDHSHRRSKAERKEGRATFRPILAFLEEGTHPEDKLVLCKRQTLRLTSWTELQRLSMMKNVLGAGIKHHLMENLFLRDVFGLGSPLGKDAEKELYTKEERKHRYAATKMYRQMERGSSRDKRSAMF